MAALAEPHAELQELRSQVDKLRERLDFMAPMLSLLNFTQDFCQRVESEASIQMRRLKHAKVTSGAAAPAPAAAEGGVPGEEAAVDLANWLRAITAFVMAAEAADARRPDAVRGDAAGAASAGAAAPAAGGGAASSRSTQAGPPLPAAPLAAGGGIPAQVAHGVNGARVVPPGGASLRLPPGARPALGAPSARAARPERSASPATPPIPAAAAAAAGRAGRHVDSTLEVGGLSLGRGTWANAYRQATGARRDALRLLCNTGIVTERELADDLTVISEDHVEECVSIAGEMLWRWPTARGPPPLNEAKAFFEERLHALYLKRAPSPMAPH